MTTRTRHGKIISGWLVAALLIGTGVTPAEAGIAFVKTIGMAGSDISGTGISVTVPPAGVALGNRIVVSFAMDPAAGLVSCIDNRGNAYSVDVDVQYGTVPNGVRTVVCSARVTMALVSGDLITVAHPVLKARAMGTFEFSGIAANPVDKSSSSTGNTGTPDSGLTATTTVADELLFGAIGVDIHAAESFLPAVGYTVLPTVSSGSSAGPTSDVTIDPEYRIVVAAGAYSAGGTLERARDWAAAIVTYRAAACADGTLDPGEGCDDGNLLDNDCCSSTCEIEPNGTVCRVAAGICDVSDTCNGVAPTCPTNALVPAGTTCRPAVGICDLPEACTGASPNCPTDAKSTAVCRAAAGACDVAESCDGGSDTCPVDALIPPTAVCRTAFGVCDVVEFCTGLGTTCPADIVRPSGTPCRAAASFCDFPETCDGASSACPADATVPDGTVCDDGSACTVGDACAAGACVGTVTPTACIDDMMCYITKATATASTTSLHLADTIESGTFTVRKPRDLCTPAALDGVPPLDAATTLTSYRVRKAAEEPKHQKQFGLRVRSAIGEVSVDTIKVDTLLVASGVGPTSPAPGARDNYKCYKLRMSAGVAIPPKAYVTVADAFTTSKILGLKKPKLLCAPVAVDGGVVSNSDAVLLCYTARPAKGQPKHARQKNLLVTDSLGGVVMSTIRESPFCLPADLAD